MMRPSSLYLLLAFLVLLGVLSSGCTLLGGEPSGNEAGLTDITEYTRDRSTLDEALDTLRSDQQKGLMDLAGLELTQVLGIRVDRSGSARTWTLGYRGEGNTTRILEYSAGSWEMVDAEIPLPTEPIPMDQLIRPKRLFELQKVPIGDAYARQGVNESELMLRGETYTITVPSPSRTTILTFDARTGGVRASS